MDRELEEKLLKVKSYSTELGLDLSRPEDRFKWFIASMLFAKRISSEIAKRTFRRFLEEGLTTPEKILSAGWDKLVEVLDSGGYVRYDFSTATNILEAVKLLKEKYDGSIDEVHSRARSPADLEKRLMEFRGMGPVAVNIFLRELQGIWVKAKPKPSSLAIKTARKLGLNEEVIRVYEPYLVKIFIEYCKKVKCRSCPVESYCREKRK